MNEWEWHALEDTARVESITVAGVPVRTGDRVRLLPRSGGDVFDIALAGKIAVVEGIEQDYEGKHHLSVVVDEDPGNDIGMMRQPGHRFFFSAAEVEPLGPAAVPQEETKKSPTILIAGIGNIFMGDDAFGVEVIRRLANREWPRGVRAVDFGIRGLDLAYALIDRPGVTILVDACPKNGTPGDLYVVEPDVSSRDAVVETVMLDAHGMNPTSVIRAAQMMGGPLGKILLLGCEPLSLGSEQGHMGLSDPVAGAVDRAIPLLESLVRRILDRELAADS
ncbi:MAG: hydrogenase maturation protease [Candidatus Acidiferrales bacterium]